ncbi:MAG: hypothetical protein R6X06_09975 [Gammaproteobacteria bacterium]
MSHYRNERETTERVSRTITERRTGQDRRQQTDRRCEPRFGDVLERRQTRDRRRAIGNLSID